MKKFSKILALALVAMSGTAVAQPYSVTFNVDMNAVAAETFTASTHTVYMTGTVASPEWATPGAAGSVAMTDEDADGIYSAVLELEAKEYEFKFFANPNGQESWDYGEWTAGDNRKITISAEATLDYTFGVYGITSVGNANSQAISVFPNPATTELFVRDAQGARAVLFSLTGQRVIEATNLDAMHRFDLSQLAAGVYVLQVNRGGATSVERVVVR